MKQKILFLVFVIASIFPSFVSAQDMVVSRAQVFGYLADMVDDRIPQSYTYIDVQYTDIDTTDPVYEALQVLVYIDAIDNRETRIYPTKTLPYEYFRLLVTNILWEGYVSVDDTRNGTLTTESDLENLSYVLDSEAHDVFILDADRELRQKKAIFNDVYETLIENHINNGTLDKKEMIDEAIKGMAEATGDKYTTYFPPVDSASFNDTLNGEYQGIGAYVEMQEAGVLNIVSPMVGSPAEKAGLKWGDRIYKVAGKLIMKDTSLQEAVSWIKWPAGTTVILTIIRDGDEFDVEVGRANIIVKDVEVKYLQSDTFYIQIKNFGDHVARDFVEALNSLKEKTKVRKVIIDLRNNPGGYLDQVNLMLSYFVPKWEPTSVVKYRDVKISNKSYGYSIVDFSNYTLVILQNSGSASASEIMIGTIKDYYPDTILIGETTYGKGSVQTIKQYVDGSSLKYTIAKWYTGKNEIGIDGIGIEPDIELPIDVKQFEQGMDNQLNKALQQ